MSAANFKDFYGQTCEFLKLKQVVLEPDAKGARAFTITWRGAQMSFTERANVHGDHVSITMRFGPAPEERRSEILSNLMRSGYLMMAVGAAFVMSPKTGDIYLHHQSPLSSFHVPGMQTMLDAFAEAFARWSSTYFLEGGQSASSSEFGLAAFA